MYCYVKNSVIAEGPRKLPKSHKNVSNLYVLSDEELKSKSWYKVIEGELPTYDSIKEYLVDSYVVDDVKGEVLHEYTKKKYTEEEKTANFLETQTQMLEALAAIRYEKQISGVTVDGTMYATDPLSAGLMAGAYLLVQIDPTVVINWKAKDKSNNKDWKTFDADTIIAFASAVGKHIQMCFTRERELYADITSAKKMEDLIAINLTVGWPS